MWFIKVCVALVWLSVLAALGIEAAERIELHEHEYLFSPLTSFAEGDES